MENHENMLEIDFSANEGYKSRRHDHGNGKKRKLFDSEFQGNIAENVQKMNMKLMNFNETKICDKYKQVDINPYETATCTFQQQHQSNNANAVNNISKKNDRSILSYDYQHHRKRTANQNPCKFCSSQSGHKQSYHRTQTRHSCKESFTMSYNNFNNERIADKLTKGPDPKKCPVQQIIQETDDNGNPIKIECSFVSGPVAVTSIAQSKPKSIPVPRSKCKPASRQQHNTSKKYYSLNDTKVAITTSTMSKPMTRSKGIHL